MQQRPKTSDSAPQLIWHLLFGQWTIPSAQSTQVAFTQEPVLRYNITQPNPAETTTRLKIPPCVPALKNDMWLKHSNHDRNRLATNEKWTSEYGTYPSPTTPFRLSSTYGVLWNLLLPPFTTSNFHLHCMQTFCCQNFTTCAPVRSYRKPIL